MNACASCACCGRRRLAGADRPDRLVREHEALVRPDGLGERGRLTSEHCLGLPRLPLGLELSDARDDLEPGFQRVRGPPGCRLVGLAEERSSLRVPDDGAVDPHLQQHLRGDLARVGARRLPVHALREDLDPRPAERSLSAAASETYGGQTATRTPSRSASCLGQRRAEGRGLGRPLVLLPVAGDEGHGPHRGILPAPEDAVGQAAGIAITPGSSRPSRSSSEAPPPVETQPIRSASPSSSIARTESPPPTTVNPGQAATASADRLRPVGEAGPLEDPHRPVPEHRARLADPLGEDRARLRSDVQPEPALGKSIDLDNTRSRHHDRRLAAATTSTGRSTSPDASSSERKALRARVPLPSCRRRGARRQAPPAAGARRSCRRPWRRR